MRVIALTLSLIFSMSLSEDSLLSSKQPRYDNTTNILTGFLIGVYQIESLQDGGKCALNQRYIEDIEKIHTIFKNKSINGYFNKGLQNIEDFVDDLTQIKDQCYHQDVIEKVKNTTAQLVELVKQPRVMAVTAAKNFLNYKEIIEAHMDKAEKHRRAGNGDAFGSDMGDIVHVLLLGYSHSIADEAATKLATGFMYGFFKLPSFNTASPCLGNTKFGKYIGDASKAIKEKDHQKALGAIANASKVLPDTLIKCNISVSEQKVIRDKLNKTVHIAQDQVLAMTAITSGYALHMFAVNQQFAKMKDAIVMHDNFNVGLTSGNIAALLLFGEKAISRSDSESFEVFDDQLIPSILQKMHENPTAVTRGTFARLLLFGAGNQKGISSDLDQYRIKDILTLLQWEYDLIIDDDSSNTIENIQGLLYGFFKVRGLKTIDVCLPSTKFGDDILQAFKHAKSFEIELVQQDLLQAKADLKPSLDECGIHDVDQDSISARLNGTIGLLEDPRKLEETVTQNMILHARAINKQRALLQQALSQNDSYVAGLATGNIAALILFGDGPVTMNLEQYKEGVLGFLDGFYRQEFIGDDIDCYSQGVLAAGTYAMSAFAALKMGDLREAIRDFTDSLLHMNSSLDECYNESHWEQMAAVNHQAIKMLENKDEFVKTVKENSLQYAAVLGADVTKIYHGVQRHHDATVGIAIGDIIHVLLFGNESRARSHNTQQSYVIANTQSYAKISGL